MLLRLLRFASVAVLPLAGACAFAACSSTSTTTPVAPAADAGDATVSAADAADAPVEVSDGKCHPGPSTGFTSAPYAPPKPGYQELCTDVQIQAYVDCAGGNATACTALQADGGLDCRDCIESKQSDATWGPLVYGGVPPAVELNEPGCAALDAGDTTTSGCGQALANYAGCLHSTCREQCPADYFNCARETRGTSCKAFTEATATSCAGADVASCFAKSGDSADDLSKRIIKRFCGTP